jgi:hypothetical protein
MLAADDDETNPRASVTVRRHSWSPATVAEKTGFGTLVELNEPPADWTVHEYWYGASPPEAAGVAPSAAVSPDGIVTGVPAWASGGEAVVKDRTVLLLVLDESQPACARTDQK